MHTAEDNHPAVLLQRQIPEVTVPPLVSGRTVPSSGPGTAWRHRWTAGTHSLANSAGGVAIAANSASGVAIALSPTMIS